MYEVDILYPAGRRLDALLVWVVLENAGYVVGRIEEYDGREIRVIVRKPGDRVVVTESNITGWLKLYDKTI